MKLDPPTPLGAGWSSHTIITNLKWSHWLHKPALNIHREGGRHSEGLRGHNCVRQLPPIGLAYLLLVCHSGCEEDGKPSEPTLMNIVEPSLVKKKFFYKYVF